MAQRRCLGSFVLIASFLLEGHCSPELSAKQNNLLQKSSKKVELEDSLSAEESQMFAEIWAKFVQGSFMSLEQLNLLFRATDHELGEQVFTDTEWQLLCKEKGADPDQGLSRHDLLSMYFDDRTHPESSIKRDYIRIFAEGGTPQPPVQKNLLQKISRPEISQKADLVKSMSPEDTQMFNEIWVKYKVGDFMSLEQFNALLRDTDHELGKQVVSDSWWQSLCTEQRVDPSKGLSQQNLLSLYLTKNIGSSIKQDYIRIFLEGAMQTADIGKNPPETHSFGHHHEPLLIV
jgi:hypothetical protein